MMATVGHRVYRWLYTRYLELRLGWLTIKAERLRYELRKLRRNG